MPDSLFDVLAPGLPGDASIRLLHDVLRFDCTLDQAHRLGRALVQAVEKGDIGAETLRRLDAFDRIEIEVMLRWAVERRVSITGIVDYVTLRVGPGRNAPAQPNLFSVPGLYVEEPAVVSTTGFAALARIRDREGHDVGTASARIARVMLRADLLGNLSPRAVQRIAAFSYWEALAVVDQLATYGLVEQAVLACYEQSVQRPVAWH